MTSSKFLATATVTGPLSVGIGSDLRYGSNRPASKSLMNACKFSTLLKEKVKKKFSKTFLRIKIQVKFFNGLKKI